MNGRAMGARARSGLAIRSPCPFRLPRLISVFLAVACLPCVAGNSAGELYCGKENCYSLLGLTRDAAASEIKKSFRKLALQWHPDKNKSPSAPAKFRAIGRAHEVLSEEKLRRAYDYFLDHPEESYTHYYQYYHAAYSPQTPLWVVLLGVLSFLSALQYINQNWKYSSMMRAIRYQPQFKRRVNERVEEEIAAMKCKVSKAEREILREQMETQVLGSEVQMIGSGFSKPDMMSLLIVRAARLPWDVPVALFEVGKWHWRFSIQGEAYGAAEQEFLTRRALGLSPARWEAMEETEREKLVVKELWQREKMKAFHSEQQEEMRERMAQSGAYRRAKRWMRNNR